MRLWAPDDRVVKSHQRWADVAAGAGCRPGAGGRTLTVPAGRDGGGGHAGSGAGVGAPCARPGSAELFVPSRIELAAGAAPCPI